MDEPVVSVDSNQTVLAAGEEMVARQVRHLALVDADGVNGLITARDGLACLLLANPI
jgi:CBS domain-containing protein